jgi:hypothetical protein
VPDERRTARSEAFGDDDHGAEHASPGGAVREGSHGVADPQVEVLRADPLLEVQPTQGVA